MRIVWFQSLSVAWTWKRISKWDTQIKLNDLHWVTDFLNPLGHGLSFNLMCFMSNSLKWWFHQCLTLQWLPLHVAQSAISQCTCVWNTHSDLRIKNFIWSGGSLPCSSVGPEDCKFGCRHKHGIHLLSSWADIFPKNCRATHVSHEMHAFSLPYCWQWEQVWCWMSVDGMNREWSFPRHLMLGLGRFR